MRLIHRVPFSPAEIEHYRQLVFDNIVRGIRTILEAMEEMDLQVEPENEWTLEVVDVSREIRDGEPFPRSYHKPLVTLWTDPNVRKAWERGNEAALPEKYVVFLCP